MITVVDQVFMGPPHSAAKAAPAGDDGLGVGAQAPGGAKIALLDNYC
jgi:hypothetical protein